MDPNLKNFAVFINSSSSVNKTTKKSDVQIPLMGQLAASDPTKALQVMLSQFRFTNSMYNIDESKNTLKIVCEFAPGRGYGSDRPDRLWQTWVVRVPPGTYNTEQLCSYLSLPGTLYPEQNIGPLKQYINKVGYESISQMFEYGAIPANYDGAGNPAFPAKTTYADCWAGFGAIPADPTDQIKTPGVVTADNSTRTVFQSPDLSHLIQYGTDITSPCANIIALGGQPTNTSLDYSFVYKGIYLLFDAQTEGLLKMLGYYNIDRIPAPVIVDYHNNDGILTSARGYGIQLEADTVYKAFPSYDENGNILAYNGVTMRPAYQNTTYYRVRAMTGLTKDELLIAPDFPTPTPFSGYFPGASVPSTTVTMYVLYSINLAATDYLYLSPGMFIAGTGVTVPSPYLVDFIETTFDAFTTVPTPPATTSPEIKIDETVWDDNNGFGLTVGSPITTTAEYDPLTAVVDNYVVSIAAPVPPSTDYIITLNADLPTFLCDGLPHEFKTNVYTLNIPQSVTNIIGTYSNWVATLASINDRSARLVPNLLTNLEGVGEIHIHAAQLRTQYMSSTNFQPLAPSDVIAVVPVDVPFGSSQSYQPPVTLVAYLTNVNIVNLAIQLTNAAGIPLDFNGMDWSMVLKCEEVEVKSEVEQNNTGTLNTMFQDQLQQMESTAPQQIRLTRHRNKRLLPYQFFDNNEINKKIQSSL